MVCYKPTLNCRAGRLLLLKAVFMVGFGLGIIVCNCAASNEPGSLALENVSLSSDTLSLPRDKPIEITFNLGGQIKSPYGASLSCFIKDSDGKLIRTIGKRITSSGSHRVVWDGKKEIIDFNDPKWKIKLEPAEPGVYSITLQVDDCLRHHQNFGYLIRIHAVKDRVYLAYVNYPELGVEGIRRIIWNNGKGEYKLDKSFFGDGLLGKIDGVFDPPCVSGGALTVDISRNILYVIQFGVRRLDLTTGKELKWLGVEDICKVDWPKLHPMHIAVDKGGNIYITRRPYAGGALLKFDSKGFYDKDFGGGDGIVDKEDNGGDFMSPGSIAIDHRGNDDPTDDYIYVADTNNNLIKRFTAQGELMDGSPGPVFSKKGMVGIGIKTGIIPYLGKDPGTGEGEFLGPCVAVDKSGNVYVGERSSRIQVFDSTGKFKRIFWNSEYHKEGPLSIIDIEEDSLIAYWGADILKADLTSVPIACSAGKVTISAAKK